MKKPTINRRQFLPLLLAPLSLIKSPLHVAGDIGWGTDLMRDVAVMIKRLNKDKYHPIRCIDKKNLIFELASSNPEIVTVDKVYPSSFNGTENPITINQKFLRYPFDVDFKYGSTRMRLTALDKTIYPPKNKIRYCAYFKSVEDKKESRVHIKFELPRDDIKFESWEEKIIHF